MALNSLKCISNLQLTLPLMEISILFFNLPLNRFLIVKVLVGAFNKEKASEGALSVIVIVIANLRCQL